MTDHYANLIMNKTGKGIVLAKNVFLDLSYQELAEGPDPIKIKAIIQETSCQMLVVAAVRTRTISVSALGITGYTVLDTALSLFDAEGRMTGQATFTSDMVTGAAANVEAYQQVLDSYTNLASEIVDLLF